MGDDLVNRSAVLSLTTYLIADYGVDFPKGTSLQAIVQELKRDPNANQYYVDTIQKAIDSDPSMGGVAILKTSMAHDYASPMAAVCFRDGDNVYVQYRGTPDGGWVQNPISYGADINEANAADGVSSQIQADGLDFFNECAHEFAGYGHAGKLIVGGHSQGGNVSEYVTMMSEYAALIDLCVSLDGPSHSQELYDYIIENFGEEYFAEMSQKIIAINGNNDYVNMQGQVDFAAQEYYIDSDDAWADENGHGGLWGWHDLLYLLDRDTGELLPHDAEQGPVGRMMADIVAQINGLPQEQQEDCAIAIMGVLEFMLGSKDWKDLEDIGLDAEEVIGFLAHGLPILLASLAANPEALGQIINGYIPEDIKEGVIDFINNTPAPLVIAALIAGTLVAVVIVGAAVALVNTVIAAARILDFIITAVQTGKDLAEKAWRAVVNICNTLKAAIGAIAEFMHSLSAGVRYASANPYISVDTDKLRGYAARINSVNNRLKNLDSGLRGLYWQVGLLDLWDILYANLLTSGSPTLNQVKSYLNEAADRFEAAENQARKHIKG
jgi:hypothetical protein